MHILEIPSFFTPYGGEFCLEQARALKALGHEVRILSNVQLGITVGGKDYAVLPFTRFEHERDGITIYQSYQRGLPHMVHHNVMRWISIVQSMFEQYVHKYGKPDILHAHCAKWAGYAAMKISKQYHIPYVITEHLSKLVFETEFGLAPVENWQIQMLKQAYSEASYVIPVSEELVDDIACYFGKDYRWKSISNIVDTDFFAYKSRSSKENRPYTFCCLANNWPLKGYDVLLPAFRQLRDKGIDVVLQIAGRGTDSADFRSKLSEGMTAYGLLNRHAVRDLLYQSDALVLASRSEVQPLVLLEAMSTGIPVIATECIPQNLRIEGGCTIVPTDDVEALADAMKQATEQIADDKLISEKVKAIASPQVVGQELSNLFIQLIS
jgi:glycosyltransferase involved in cell wall biosynthesis